MAQIVRKDAKPLNSDGLLGEHTQPKLLPTELHNWRVAIEVVARGAMFLGSARDGFGIGGGEEVGVAPQIRHEAAPRCVAGGPRHHHLRPSARANAVIPTDHFSNVRGAPIL